MRAYRFGDFELDLDAMQLRLNDEPVRLERRPLDLLILLVSREGALVTREELFVALWPPGIVVDFETGLNTLVRKVRIALRDSSDNPAFIETVPGRGYRFIASVTATSQQVEPDAANLADGSFRVSRRAIAVALLAVAGGGGYLWRRHLRPKTIAVHAFEDLTGNDAGSFLARAFADVTRIALSHALAEMRLPRLVVLGRASAGDASELDADLVIEGSLRMDSDKLQLNVELVRVSSREVLWSQSFKHFWEQRLEFENEVAIAIVEQIRMELSPGVRAAIERRQTQNPDAWDLYQKGMQVWDQVSRGSVHEALGYFEQATQLDPTYALAWAGKAHALITSPMTLGSSRAEVESEAREALDQAMHYGEELAEVQSALGYYLNIVEWDTEASIAAVERSIRLDENNPIAHMQLGMRLSQQGRFDEALRSLKRARELDSQFALLFANSALVEAHAGNPEAGLRRAKQAVAMGEGVWAAHFQLGNVLMILGDDAAARGDFTVAHKHYADALDAYSAAEFTSGRKDSQQDSRAVALARLGNRDEARALLEDMYARWRDDERVSPIAFAVVHASLGNIDEAFEWLRRGLDARDVGMLSIHNDFSLKALHTDPRFDELLRDIAAVARTRPPR